MAREWFFIIYFRLRISVMSFAYELWLMGISTARAVGELTPTLDLNLSIIIFRKTDSILPIALSFDIGKKQQKCFRVLTRAMIDKYDYIDWHHDWYRWRKTQKSKYRCGILANYLDLKCWIVGCQWYQNAVCHMGFKVDYCDILGSIHTMSRHLQDICWT